MLPYQPPAPDREKPLQLVSNDSIPGRFAIWSIATISFFLGFVSLYGAWALWRMQALDDLAGFAYYYYALRPAAMAVGFFGLFWKCLRYVDAVTHKPIESPEVRLAHGGVWNWMAAMLAMIMVMMVYQFFMH